LHDEWFLAKKTASAAATTQTQLRMDIALTWGQTIYFEVISRNSIPFCLRKGFYECKLARKWVTI